MRCVVLLCLFCVAVLFSVGRAQADVTEAKSPLGKLAADYGVRATRVFDPGLPAEKLVLEYYPPVAPRYGTSEGHFRIFRTDGKPFPADDLITIETTSHSYSSLHPVDAKIEIALIEGETEAIGTFVQTPAFCISGSYWYELRVFNGRRRLLGLEEPYFREFGWSSSSSGEYSDLLVLPHSLESKRQFFKDDQSQLGKLNRAYRDMQKIPQRYLTTDLAYSDQYVSCLLTRLPDNWLLLAGFGRVYLQQSDWQSLSAGQKSALQSYVDSGGILVFTGCDSSGNELLDTPMGIDLFGLDAKEKINLGFSSEPILNAWSPFYEFAFWRDRYSYSAPTYPGPYQGSSPSTFFPDDGLSSGDWGYSFDDWLDLFVGYLDFRLFSFDAFAWRTDLLPEKRSGMLYFLDQLARASGKSAGGDFYYVSSGGGIYCFLKPVTPNSIDVSSKDRITAAACDEQKYSSDWWTNRGFKNGEQSNSDLYSHGLISQIGKPPVLWFAGLLGVFSLIVGPGILAFTTYARRQTWLMLIFPVVGLVFTVGLFAFAILHDGFETYTRVRSFTTYDDRTQTAFCVSQQTHFSGSPPDIGLVFEADTEANNLLLQEESIPRSFVQYRDGRQHWVNSVRAREQCQYLVQHPLPKRDRFQIEQNDETLTVTNLSGSDWEFFAFCDEDNRLWMGDGLPAGREIELQSIALDDNCFEVLQSIRNVYDEGAVPVDSFKTLDLFNFDVTRFYSGSETSMMGIMLANWEPIRATRNTDRQFIAVVTEPEYIDLGYDDSTPIEDAHFLFGRW